MIHLQALNSLHPRFPSSLGSYGALISTLIGKGKATKVGKETFFLFTSDFKYFHFQSSAVYVSHITVAL